MMKQVPDDIIDFVISTFDNPRAVDFFLVQIQKQGVTIHGDLSKMTQDDKQRFAIELWVKLCDGARDETPEHIQYLH